MELSESEQLHGTVETRDRDEITVTLLNEDWVRLSLYDARIRQDGEYIFRREEADDPDLRPYALLKEEEIIALMDALASALCALRDAEKEKA